MGGKYGTKMEQDDYSDIFSLSITVKWNCASCRRRAWSNWWCSGHVACI